MTKLIVTFSIMRTHQKCDNCLRKTYGTMPVSVSTSDRQMAQRICDICHIIADSMKEDTSVPQLTVIHRQHPSSISGNAR
jgi:hypothetical protein